MFIILSDIEPRLIADQGTATPLISRSYGKTLKLVIYALVLAVAYTRGNETIVWIMLVIETVMTQV